MQYAIETLLFLADRWPRVMHEKGRSMTFEFANYRTTQKKNWSPRPKTAQNTSYPIFLLIISNSFINKMNSTLKQTDLQYFV